MEITKKYAGFFFFILLFLATYQDLPLVNHFGEIARTPIVFLSPFFLIYILSQKEIILSKNTTYLAYYFLYIAFITVLYIPIVYFLNGNSLNVLYENLLIKTTKMLVYPAIILIFYQFCYTYFRRMEKPLITLFQGFFVFQIFITIWLIFEAYYLKTPTLFASLIHSTPFKYWRVRLWTLEESWTGSILIITIFFPLYLLMKNPPPKWQKIISISCSISIFIIYALVSESKGFILLLLIGVLPLLIRTIRKSPQLKRISNIILVLVVLLLIPLSLSFYQHFIQQFFLSITFGTRFTSVYAALDTFIHTLIGCGYSGYLYLYPKAVEDAIYSGNFNQFALEEIKLIMASTKALSTKSEFFDQLIYGGLVYLYFFYKFFIQRIRYFISFQKTRVVFLFIPLIFITLASVVYITYTIKYEIWLFLALLDFIQQKSYE